MTSKHYKWQQRWRVDVPAGVATHESGLRVTFPNGRARAHNADDVQAALAVKNGPHNAPQMLQRLVREAEDLWNNLYAKP